VDSVSDWTGNVGLAELETWGTEPVVSTPEPTPTPIPEPTPEPTPTPVTEPAPESSVPTGENLAGQATVTASSENVWDGQTAV
ncbi:hypothetical protein, partial [Modestobacter sp. VKM Ac-2978]|uniref:hypothetical protein n=1 Tax=Modestobacter sp. VKM Ac-2978 TaxID=3004132 RepID=UPI0022AA6510